MGLSAQRPGVLPREDPESKVLELVYVSSREVAESLAVLPETMYEIRRGDPEASRSIDRWWSPEFREMLYSDLGPILEAPRLASDEWSAIEILRVAGIGLISVTREEIGFGIDLVTKVMERAPLEVRFIIDGTAGLRYVQVFDAVAKAVTGPRFRLYHASRLFRSTVVRLLRVPLGPTSTLVARASSWRTRNRRSSFRPGQHSSDVLRSVAGPTLDVAVFEATSKGWEFSGPIVQELRRRGLAVAEAMPQSGIKVVDGPGAKALSVGSPPPFEGVGLADMSQAVQTLIGVSKTSHLITDSAHLRVTSNVISRRASAYLPGLATGASLARSLVGELGAGVTVQEGHTSPSARAFLLEAKRLGAHTVTTHHGLFDATAPERRYHASPDTVLEWGDQGATLQKESATSRVVGSHVVERKLAEATSYSGGGDEGPIVLVAFGRPGRIVDPTYFASSIRLVGTAASLTDGVTFIVNLHPGDSKPFWDVALSPLGEHGLEFTRNRIYELMHRTVALVTHHSTAGAEAILAGVPVISVTDHRDPVSGDLHEMSHVPGYVSDGVAYTVGSAQELAILVVELLTAKGRDPLAGARVEYGKTIIDRSSERPSHHRAADIIEELTGTHAH